MNDADMHGIVAAATRHEAPARLSRNITAAVRASDAGSAPVPKAAPVVRAWPRMAGAFACGLAVAWLSAAVLHYGETPDPLITEAVADHVRSMMAAHLMDVASSDQHTVKPWFNGKLAYSPPVRDLSAQGFTLAGGRLDYLGGQSVAALVYRHRLHLINLFVMPCQAAASASATSARDGFNVIGWCDSGMRYLAVSDLNAEELSQFTQLLGEKAKPR